MEMSFALGGWSLKELTLRIHGLSTEAPAVASVFICATKQLPYVTFALVLRGDGWQAICNFAVLNSNVYPTIANETCSFPKNMWAT
jgi:hypothetical protein